MRFQPIVLAACLSTLAAGASAQIETVNGDNEPPFQLNNMHTCPNGSGYGNWAMSGVHVGNNDFLCLGSFYPYISSIVVDAGSSGNQHLMPDGRYAHWCGPNSMMAGVHVGDNRFSCTRFTSGFLQAVPQPLGPPVVDYSTQRSNMHACPRGSVMVGAYFDDNILLCSKLNFCLTTYGDAGCPSGQSCQAITLGSHIGTCG